MAEGYRVVGFDIERHVYGDAKYPAQLVLQDVLTIHGLQFKDAALIVASPPCQEYSYMAMPWTRAKTIAAEYRSGVRDVAKLTALFDACFRIQREASEAAGHHIPLVVENVRGAIPWVGRSRWNFGSFHLWGDVPALMPIPAKKHVKVATMGGGWYPPDHPKHVRGLAFNGHADRALRSATKGGYGLSPGKRFSDRSAANPLAHREGNRCSFVGGSIDDAPECCDRCGRNYDDPCHLPDGMKTLGHANKRDCYSHTRHLTNQAESDSIRNAQEGRKQKGSGAAWWRGEVGSKSSKSNARKAASAHIAKIPFVLSSWIGRCYKPEPKAVSA